MWPVLDACEERVYMCAYPMSAAMVDRYSSCVRRRISKTCTIDAGPVGKTALDDGTGLEEAAEEEKDDVDTLVVEEGGPEKNIFVASRT